MNVRAADTASSPLFCSQRTKVMSNYKELADKCVEHGADQCGHDYRWIEADVIDSLPANIFVTDWRVAGALMEKCRERGYVGSINPDGVVMYFTGRDEPHDCCESESTEWPRAIIEACVGALEQGIEP